MKCFCLKAHCSFCWIRDTMTVEEFISPALFSCWFSLPVICWYITVIVNNLYFLFSLPPPPSSCMTTILLLSLFLSLSCPLSSSVAPQAPPQSSVMTMTLPALFITSPMATTPRRPRRWVQTQWSLGWQRFLSLRTHSTSVTPAACWKLTRVSYCLARQTAGNPDLFW